jgi:hypothetical protein
MHAHRFIPYRQSTSDAARGFSAPQHISQPRTRRWRAEAAADHLDVSRAVGGCVGDARLAFAHDFMLTKPIVRAAQRVLQAADKRFLIVSIQ